MPKLFAKRLREHRDTVEENDGKLAAEGLKQGLMEGHGQRPEAPGEAMCG